MSTIVQEPVTEAPAPVSAPVLDEETRRVLQDVRRVLLEEGWCQRYPELHGRYCIYGALNLVTGGRGSSGFFGANHLLLEACGNSYINWNDDPSRTKAEVIDLFDRLLAA